MLVSLITEASTYSVHGLDMQILETLQRIIPGSLARIDDIKGVVLGGKHVHPYLQAPVRGALMEAVNARGDSLVINSACRTIAGQLVLRNHYLNGRHGITAAAKPGRSNHNNLTAIDIEDSEGWRPYLRNAGFEWLGGFDPMHYDFTGDEVKDLVKGQVMAFQDLWSNTNPKDKIAVDGDLGDATLDRLGHAPAEGWYVPPGTWLPQRILRLTKPCQVGQDVKDLQIALRNKGIRIIFDGVYGSDTDRAIKEFQSKNSLETDGILGDRTRAALGLSNALIDKNGESNNPQNNPQSLKNQLIGN
jgi:N-acetylmuramoyl-L-alanine amidase